MILFKITSRSRPQRFTQTLHSILSNCVTRDYRIIVSLDADDPHLKSYNTETHGAEFMKFVIGKSTDKINAINRDVEGDWDILVNVSDDQVFTKYGFDEQIINDFDNLDHVIHYPDGYRKQDLMSMSIIGRAYYERDGFIYNPVYKSFFCDNEAKDVAVLRGKYKYVDQQIFEHLHPDCGKGQYDELYKHNSRYFNQDREVYELRKKHYFYLNATN